jgi:hypothetical protein
MINPRKFLVYGIIAIAVITLLVSFNTILTRFSSNNGVTAVQPTVQPIADLSSNSSAIEQFREQFCGIESNPNSNNYVTEYKMPHPCEMPLGIAVDSQVGKVWYISTKQECLEIITLYQKNLIKRLVSQFGVYAKIR